MKSAGISFLIVGFILPIIVTACDCSAGWVHRQHSESWYLFSNVALGWPAAFSYCTHQGGYLVRLETAEEMNWMDHYMRTANSTYRFTGAYKDFNGQFRWWVTGSLATDPLFKISNWGPTQPNNLLGGSNIRQSCMIIYDSSRNYTWDDAWCGIEAKFICEKNAL